MKRLSHGELRDLTCPRHIVVYWQSCQKHFPTPSPELWCSACYYHPLLKINTNPAWNMEESTICGEQEKKCIWKWKSVVTSWPNLYKPFCVIFLSRPSHNMKEKKKKEFGCNPLRFINMCSGLIYMENSSAYKWSPGIDWLVGGIVINPCYLLETFSSCKIASES